MKEKEEDWMGEGELQDKDGLWKGGDIIGDEGVGEYTNGCQGVGDAVYNG